MRKLAGWLLVILCCAISVATALAISFVLYFVVGTQFMKAMARLDTAIFMVMFLIAVILVSKGFIKGIRLISASYNRTLPEYKDFTITINGSIDAKKFCKMNYRLAFSNSSYYLLLLVTVFFFQMAWLASDGKTGMEKVMYGAALCFLLLLLADATSFVNQQYRYYDKRSKTTFTGVLFFRLDNQNFRLADGKREVAIPLTDFYKIKETKDFFVFYQQERSSSPILVQKDRLYKEQEDEMRLFLKSLPIFQS